MEETENKTQDRLHKNHTRHLPGIGLRMTQMKWSAMTICWLDQISQSIRTDQIRDKIKITR